MSGVLYCWAFCFFRLHINSYFWSVLQQLWKIHLGKTLVKGCWCGGCPGAGAAGDGREGMFSLRQVSSAGQKSNKVWMEDGRRWGGSSSAPRSCKGLSKASDNFAQEETVELSSWFNYFPPSPGHLCVCASIRAECLWIRICSSDLHVISWGNGLRPLDLLLLWPLPELPCSPRWNVFSCTIPGWVSSSLKNKRPC